ncbi:MAG: FAD-binding protein [Elusimicrobiales bacterium]
MAKITVNEARCTGCGSCLKVCPEHCIMLAASDSVRTETKGKVPYPSLAVIDEGACSLCGACASACAALAKNAPEKNLFNAITLAARETAGKDISAYKNVWCYAEVLHGEINPVSYELLSVGATLAADLGADLCAVVLGGNSLSFASELVARGAKKVYVCESPELENFVDDVYAKCLADIVKTYKPDKFLLPATTIGRSLAAKVAILCDTGLTADATSAVIDKASGLMHVTRPTFGGNLMATITCAHSRPEMCSLRPLTYPQAKPDYKRRGEVINFKFSPAKYASKTKFVSFVQEEAGEIDIGAAEIIVAGGRGVGKAEGFHMLHDLAKELGGAVGASRAAVDSGWVAYRHQVGLTGKTVKPKIYIACGISGQVQHLAGMTSSDVIISVNKDAQAALMDHAHYAVEGDLHEIVPALIDEIRKIKSGA